MKAFMDKHFLLETKTARKLYHSAAENQPIWDYHCHLSPKEIADNRQFTNITEIWLGGDHYKWRQMRTAGIPEKYITGDADPYEKFLAWARTVERLMGNPLYHWTHLELQRYFGIYEPLSEKTAPAIWEKANAMLARPELSVKGIFERMNVYAVGTTDDPADTLEYHRMIADGTAAIGKIKTKVVPSFRPDKALYIEQADFASYIARLSEAAGTSITNPDELLAALEARLVFFKEHGCRASDHALPCPPFAAPFADDAALAHEKQLAFAAFERAMESSALSEAACADKAEDACKAAGAAPLSEAENADKAGFARDKAAGAAGALSEAACADKAEDACKAGGGAVPLSEAACTDKAEDACKAGGGAVPLSEAENADKTGKTAAECAAKAGTACDKAWDASALSEAACADKASTACKAAGAAPLSEAESANKAPSADKAWGPAELSEAACTGKAEDACKAAGAAPLSEARSANKAPSADKAWGPAELSEAQNAYKAYVLSGLAALYKKHGIVMQLHFGATRSNNPVMFKALGPDTGFDACDDQNIAAPLSSLLGRMEAQCEGMPRTILYSLNPKDYQAIGTLMGAFQGAGLGDAEAIPGKIQLGAAWWFCDHRDGMETQLKALGNLGMLSSFVGMLTDSRSFLSYPRHEYFRRILCNLIGGWVENGEYPADWDALTRMVSDISFENARRFFA